MIKVRNPLIWYFPTNIKTNEETRNVIRDLFDKTKRTARLRKQIVF
jgi:hypothetical protein